MWLIGGDLDGGWRFPDAAAGAGATGDAGIGGMGAASEQAIEADRQATIASSGMMGSNADADSPSELFGDAAPRDTPPSNDPGNVSADASGGTDGGFKETTFTDDATTTTFEENSFSDETSFSSDFDPTIDESQWNETSDAATEVFDSGVVEEAASTSSGLIRTLWDFFTGDD